jgi:hypothetical protein
MDQRIHNRLLSPSVKLGTGPQAKKAMRIVSEYEETARHLTGLVLGAISDLDDAQGIMSWLSGKSFGAALILLARAADECARMGMPEVGMYLLEQQRQAEMRREPGPFSR